MKRAKIFLFFLALILACGSGFVQASSDSLKPFPPFRIASNLYYFGDKYQADYLIVTPQGNILINSGFVANVPMIKASIEKLGYKFSDTKILLISHAHADYDAGSALIKQKTNATYMVMDADVSAVESGGKTDFRYGNDLEERYQPTKVDRVLHDGDEVTLGGATLIAHLTPGHTKGCTTWTMSLTENGKKYNAVIVGGTYVNPGYKLLHNSAYPEISQDYKRTWRVLKALHCDIFLGAHGGYYGLKKKYAIMKKGAKNPFIDTDGYKKYVAKAEQNFYAEYAKQQGEQSSV